MNVLESLDILPYKRKDQIMNEHTDLEGHDTSKIFTEYLQHTCSS